MQFLLQDYSKRLYIRKRWRIGSFLLREYNTGAMWVSAQQIKSNKIYPA